MLASGSFSIISPMPHGTCATTHCIIHSLYLYMYAGDPPTSTVARNNGVCPGWTVFILDTSRTARKGNLWGPYEAIEVAEGIEENAWPSKKKHGKSEFPHQIRFSCVPQHVCLSKAMYKGMIPCESNGELCRILSRRVVDSLVQKLADSGMPYSSPK